MSEPVVIARNLGKAIGRDTILRDITVAAGPGSVVGIIAR